MPSDRREILEFTCAAIAQAEAYGFEGTAAALRETLREFARNCEGHRVALQLPGIAIQVLETGPAPKERAPYPSGVTALPA